MNPSRFRIPVVSVVLGALLTSAAPAEDPARLVTLRNNFEDAVFREISPIQKKYKEHLLKLREEYSKKGDREAVDAVSAELRGLVDPRITAAYREHGETVASTAPTQVSGQELERWLNDRQFVWKGTNADELIIKFKGNEAQVFADGRKIMEREFTVAAPNIIEFDWGNGDINTFTISDDKKSFRRFMKKGGPPHGGEIKRS